MSAPPVQSPPVAWHSKARKRWLRIDSGEVRCGMGFVVFAGALHGEAGVRLLHRRAGGYEGGMDILVAVGDPADLVGQSICLFRCLLWRLSGAPSPKGQVALRAVLPLREFCASDHAATAG